MRIDNIDLFAGSGGWEEGLRLLRPKMARRTLGVEIDPIACETALAAGHARYCTDVESVHPEDFGRKFGRPRGAMGSPPCQDDSIQNQRGKRGVSYLIEEPRRWIAELRPQWVTMEQVPSVLDRWRDYAEWLSALGYSTWTGCLYGHHYGLGQARRRAFLIASRKHEVGEPVRTHGEIPTHKRVDLSGLPAPVSGAEALGWDLAEVRAHVWRGEPEDGDWFAQRPSTTVTSTNRVAAPGYRKPGERQFAAGTIRLDIEDMSVLQSFPRDYPWYGNLSEQRRQAGNAVPPLLARAVLAVATGIEKPVAPEDAVK